jgi:hypothetical protein
MMGEFRAKALEDIPMGTAIVNATKFAFSPSRAPGTRGHLGNSPNKAWACRYAFAM